MIWQGVQCTKPLLGAVQARLGPTCLRQQLLQRRHSNSSSSGWDAQGLAAARKLLYSSDTNRHKHGIVHFVIGSAGHKLSMVERGQEEWCQEAFETWGYVRFTVEGPETLVAEFVESETGRVLDQVTVRPSPFRKQECGGR